MKVHFLTTSPYQIKLANSEDKQKVLTSTEIRSETFGDTLSQLQEDWWHAHQMEKGIFLSLLQDESISDRYSVARGLSEVIDLMNKIQVQTKAKRRAKAEATAAEGNKKAKSSVSIAAAAHLIPCGR